jgi:GTP-binding protein
VVLLLIDAEEGIAAQDTHIAGYVLDELKSVIIIVNKWDVIEKDTHTINLYTDEVRRAFKFLPYAPVMFVSALTGQRVSKIIPLAKQVYEERFFRMSTSEVNRIVRDATSRQAPPTKGGRGLKIRYASQVAVDPPKFLFHVNDTELVHFSYQRYLENQIRDVYPFTATPIQMEFRRSSEEQKKR